MCKTLSKTLAWFKEAIPRPTPKNIQTILGVHFEEVAEMVNCFRALDPATQRALEDAHRAMDHLAVHLKNGNPGLLTVPDEVELLDAVCDQIVTATGVGYHYGHDVIGGVDEVNRSNWSKFVDGKATFHEKTLKILKGPDYSKAKLAQFVPKH